MAIHNRTVVCCSSAGSPDRQVPYGLVGGGEHVYVSDMQGFVAAGTEGRRDPWREVCVEEDSHAGEDAASSRSLTRAAANSSAAVMSSVSRYG